MIKIAIIGDYNFTYNTHHATNLSLDHASDFLEIDINYYWIKTEEAALLKQEQLENFDGIWLSPSPYKNPFLITPIINKIIQAKMPSLITGDGFKYFLETIIQTHQLNAFNEKLISDNLIAGNTFQRIEIFPKSKAFSKLYEHHSPIELSCSRFSIYPQLIQQFPDLGIDIEAFNQFEEPEVLSLGTELHTFLLITGFVPQISSTRELPHPVIYTFIKACGIKVP